MTTLLEVFLAEAREALEGIATKLMQLETHPTDVELMSGLFRTVHTLKGNSGLFEFPEMTRVLHAGEDLMDAVRHGRVAYSQQLADRLLDAMDFVATLCDDIESGQAIAGAHVASAAQLAASLRQLLLDVEGPGGVQRGEAEPSERDQTSAEVLSAVGLVPADVQAAADALTQPGIALNWLVYTPSTGCFFEGDDPFFQARSTPDVLWQAVKVSEPWPALSELDAFRCVLSFQMLSSAPIGELQEHFRFVPDQVTMHAVVASSTAGTLVPSAALVFDEDHETFVELLQTQRHILRLPVQHDWEVGRLSAVVATLAGCMRAVGQPARSVEVQEAGALARSERSAAAVIRWLDAVEPTLFPSRTGTASPERGGAADTSVAIDGGTPVDGDGDSRTSRRTDDPAVGAKSLKVDQAKIDHLMNLIGEMVVSKNALPFLATRAATVFGARELSREIKAQYAVINRIVEEMQDAIMQVRMMPVSFVFQRFPRLVRDISRKLGKDVVLTLEGEDTEADKNIIEALSDPLIHIVRNSLDHGFELPAVREAKGKPATGKLVIRASHESDRVVIDITDDGKGIDPTVVKMKAYEKGLITESDLERMGDQEAINLVFASGFSTMTEVSDLSGRGVGMDVVRTAVERANGTISLESEKGRGTRIRLSLPLSMAVSTVMVVESDAQRFGVPMERVVETVRVPRASIRFIKDSMATVLRGRIIPLRAMNTLLGVDIPARANASDEVAVLIVDVGDEYVGLIVDEFCDTMEIILKPLAGVLNGLTAYAGSALMGDGSVLMVLNLKEILR